LLAPRAWVKDHLHSVDSQSREQLLSARQA